MAQDPKYVKSTDGTFLEFDNDSDYKDYMELDPEAEDLSTIYELDGTKYGFADKDSADARGFRESAPNAIEIYNQKKSPNQDVPPVTSEKASGSKASTPSKEASSQPGPSGSEPSTEPIQATPVEEVKQKTEIDKIAKLYSYTITKAKQESDALEFKRHAKEDGFFGEPTEETMNDLKVLQDAKNEAYILTAKELNPEKFAEAQAVAQQAIKDGEDPNVAGAKMMDTMKVIVDSNFEAASKTVIPINKQIDEVYEVYKKEIYNSDNTMDQARKIFNEFRINHMQRKDADFQRAHNLDTPGTFEREWEEQVNKYDYLHQNWKTIGQEGVHYKDDYSIQKRRSAFDGQALAYMFELAAQEVKQNPGEDAIYPQLVMEAVQKEYKKLTTVYPEVALKQALKKERQEMTDNTAVIKDMLSPGAKIGRQIATNVINALVTGIKNVTVGLLEQPGMPDFVQPWISAIIEAEAEMNEGVFGTPSNEQQNLFDYYTLIDVGEDIGKIRFYTKDGQVVDVRDEFGFSYNIDENSPFLLSNPQDVYDSLKGSESAEEISDQRWDLLVPKLSRTMTDMAILIYGAKGMQAAGMGAKMALLTSGYMFEYSGALQGIKDAEPLISNEDAKTHALQFATVVGSLELINPQFGVWAKASRRTIQGNYLKHFATGKYGKNEAFWMGIKDAAQQAKDAGVDGIWETIQEYSQEFGGMAVQAGTNATLGENAFDNEINVPELAELGVLSFLSASSIKGGSDLSKLDNLQIDALYTALGKYDKTLKMLQSQRESGQLTDDEYIKIQTVLEDAKILYDQLPQGVSGDQNKSILLGLYARKMKISEELANATTEKERDVVSEKLGRLTERINYTFNITIPQYKMNGKWVDKADIVRFMRNPNWIDQIVSRKVEIKAFNDSQLSNMLVDAWRAKEKSNQTAENEAAKEGMIPKADGQLLLPPKKPGETHPKDVTVPEDPKVEKLYSDKAAIEAALLDAEGDPEAIAELTTNLQEVEAEIGVQQSENEYFVGLQDDGVTWVIDGESHSWVRNVFDGTGGLAAIDMIGPDGEMMQITDPEKLIPMAMAMGNYWRNRSANGRNASSPPILDPKSREARREKRKLAKAAKLEAEGTIGLTKADKGSGQESHKLAGMKAKKKDLSDDLKEATTDQEREVINNKLDKLTEKINDTLKGDKKKVIPSASTPTPTTEVAGEPAAPEKVTETVEILGTTPEFTDLKSKMPGLLFDEIQLDPAVTTVTGGKYTLLMAAAQAVGIKTPTGGVKGRYTTESVAKVLEELEGLGINTGVDLYKRIKNAPAKVVAKAQIESDKTNVEDIYGDVPDPLFPHITLDHVKKYQESLNNQITKNKGGLWDDNMNEIMNVIEAPNDNLDGVLTQMDVGVDIPVEQLEKAEKDVEAMINRVEEIKTIAEDDKADVLNYLYATLEDIQNEKETTNDAEPEPSKPSEGTPTGESKPRTTSESGDVSKPSTTAERVRSVLPAEGGLRRVYKSEEALTEAIETISDALDKGESVTDALLAKMNKFQAKGAKKRVEEAVSEIEEKLKKEDDIAAKIKISEGYADLLSNISRQDMEKIRKIAVKGYGAHELSLDQDIRDKFKKKSDIEDRVKIVAKSLPDVYQKVYLGNAANFNSIVNKLSSIDNIDELGMGIYVDQMVGEGVTTNADILAYEVENNNELGDFITELIKRLGGLDDEPDEPGTPPTTPPPTPAPIAKKEANLISTGKKILSDGITMGEPKAEVVKEPKISKELDDFIAENFIQPVEDVIEDEESIRDFISDIEDGTLGSEKESENKKFIAELKVLADKVHTEQRSKELEEVKKSTKNISSKDIDVIAKELDEVLNDEEYPVNISEDKSFIESLWDDFTFPNTTAIMLRNKIPDEAVPFGDVLYTLMGLTPESILKLEDSFMEESVIRAVPALLKNSLKSSGNISNHLNKAIEIGDGMRRDSPLTKGGDRTDIALSIAIKNTQWLNDLVSNINDNVNLYQLALGGDPRTLDEVSKDWLNQKMIKDAWPEAVSIAAMHPTIMDIPENLGGDLTKSAKEGSYPEVNPNSYQNENGKSESRALSAQPNYPKKGNKFNPDMDQDINTKSGYPLGTIQDLSVNSGISEQTGLVPVENADMERIEDLKNDFPELNVQKVMYNGVESFGLYDKNGLFYHPFAMIQGNKSLGAWQDKNMQIQHQTFNMHDGVKIVQGPDGDAISFISMKMALGRDPEAEEFQRSTTPLKKTNDWNFTSGKEKIKTAADVANIFRNIENESVEHFFVYMQNEAGQQIVSHISSGGKSSVPVDFSKILNMATQFGATKIWHVHNHPTGSLTPTPNDLDVDNTMKRTFENTGVSVEDGVVIDLNSGEFTSYKSEDIYEDLYGVDFRQITDKGKFTTQEYEKLEKGDFPINAYTLDARIFSDAAVMKSVTVKSPDDVARVTSKIHAGGSPKFGFVLTNARLEITGVVYAETMFSPAVKKAIATNPESSKIYPVTNYLPMKDPQVLKELSSYYGTFGEVPGVTFVQAGGVQMEMLNNDAGKKSHSANAPDSKLPADVVGRAYDNNFRTIDEVLMYSLDEYGTPEAVLDVWDNIADAYSEIYYDLDEIAQEQMTNPATLEDFDVKEKLESFLTGGRENVVDPDVEEIDPYSPREIIRNPEYRDFTLWFEWFTAQPNNELFANMQWRYQIKLGEEGPEIWYGGKKRISYNSWMDSQQYVDWAKMDKYAITDRPGMVFMDQDITPVPPSHINLDNYTVNGELQLGQDQIFAINLILENFLGGEKKTADPVGKKENLPLVYDNETQRIIQRHGWVPGGIESVNLAVTEHKNSYAYYRGYSNKNNEVFYSLLLIPGEALTKKQKKELDFKTDVSLVHKRFFEPGQSKIPYVAPVYAQVESTIRMHEIMRKIAIPVGQVWRDGKAVLEDNVRVFGFNSDNESKKWAEISDPILIDAFMLNQKGEDIRAIPNAKLLEDFDYNGEKVNIGDAIAEYFNQHQNDRKIPVTERPSVTKKGFILADGPGVGKSRIEIVTALEMAERLGKPAILFSMNDRTVDHIRSEAKALGVLDKLGFDKEDLNDNKTKVWVGQYYSMKGKLIGMRKSEEGSPYSVIVFDEAHALKNTGKSARADTGVDLMDRATDYSVIATATPNDKITNMLYWMAIAEPHPPGTTFEKAIEKVASDIGLSVDVRRSYKTGELVMGIPKIKRKTKEEKEKEDKEKKQREARGEPEPKKLTSWEKVRGLVQLKREDMIKTGRFIRREFPFFGTMNVVEITESKVTGFGTLEESQKEIDENSAGRNGMMEKHHITPAYKADAVIEQIHASLAQGRKVAVFVENYNRPKAASLAGGPFPSLVEIVQNELDKQGILYAKLYGTGKKEVKNNELKKFQNTSIPVIFTTFSSGGTGIDLDDQVGDSPRDMILTTVPWGGDAFDQVLPRISRRNTKSPSRIIWMKIPGSQADAHKEAVVIPKMHLIEALKTGKDYREMEVANLYNDVLDADGNEISQEEGETSSPAFTEGTDKKNPEAKEENLDFYGRQGGHFPLQDDPNKVFENPDADPNRKIKLSAEVLKVLEEAGVPSAGLGHLPKKYLGLYNRVRKTIRLQTTQNMFTAVHEGMHYATISVKGEDGYSIFQRVKDNNNPSEIDELRDIVRKYYAEGSTPDSKLEDTNFVIAEGLAVIMERSLNTPAIFNYTVTNKVLGIGQEYNNETINILSQGFGKLAGSIKAMSPVQQIATTIDFGGKPPTIIEGLEDFWDTNRSRPFRWSWWDKKVVAPRLDESLFGKKIDKLFGRAVWVTPDKSKTLLGVTTAYYLKRQAGQMAAAAIGPGRSPLQKSQGALPVTYAGNGSLKPLRYSFLDIMISLDNVDLSENLRHDKDNNPLSNRELFSSFLVSRRFKENYDQRRESFNRLDDLMVKLNTLLAKYENTQDQEDKNNYKAARAEFHSHWDRMIKINDIITREGGSVFDLNPIYAGLVKSLVGLDATRDRVYLDQLVVTEKLDPKKPSYDPASTGSYKSESNSKLTVDTYEGDFAEAAQMYKYLNDAFLDMSAATGLISAEKATEYKGRNGYARFMRSITESVRGKESELNLMESEPRKQISAHLEYKGSDKEIIDPLIGQMMYINQVYQAGFTNLQMMRLAAYSENNPDSWMGRAFIPLKGAVIPSTPPGSNPFHVNPPVVYERKVPKKTQKNDQVEFYNNGKKEIVEINDKELQDYIENIVSGKSAALISQMMTNNKFVSGVASAARLFQLSTTGIYPFWAVSNYTVDAVSRIMNTKTQANGIQNWHVLGDVKNLIKLHEGNVVTQVAKHKALKEKFGATAAVGIGSSNAVLFGVIDIASNMINSRAAIYNYVADQKGIAPGADLTLEQLGGIRAYLSSVGQDQTMMGARFSEVQDDILNQINQLRTHPSGDKNRTGGILKKATRVVKDIPQTLMDFLRLPTDIPEVLGRFSEFHRALKEGFTDEEAVYLAEQVSVPFHTRGYNAAWNLYIATIPYFRAGLNTSMKWTLNTTESKKGLSRTLGTMGVFSAASAGLVALMWKFGDEEDQQALMNMSAQERAMYMYIPFSALGIDGGGFTRFRIPDQIGAIKGCIEIAALAAIAEDPYNADKLIEALSDNFLKIIPDQQNPIRLLGLRGPSEAVQAWTGWVPHAGKLAFEGAANVRAYPNYGPIVPPWLIENNEPYLQFADNTPAYAKWFSQYWRNPKDRDSWRNFSPMVFDHLFKNFAGRGIYGMTMLSLEGSSEMDWDRVNTFNYGRQKYIFRGDSYRDFYDQRIDVKQKYHSLMNEANSDKPLPYTTTDLWLANTEQAKAKQVIYNSASKAMATIFKANGYFYTKKNPKYSVPEDVVLAANKMMRSITEDYPTALVSQKGDVFRNYGGEGVMTAEAYVNKNAKLIADVTVKLISWVNTLKDTPEEVEIRKDLHEFANELDTWKFAEADWINKLYTEWEIHHEETIDKEFAKYN